MVPTEFHAYPRLPDELKVAIWKHAMAPPAVHHFKLNLPNDISKSSVMSIEPICGPSQKDTSIWRDTWHYSAADTISHQVIALENRLLIWQLDKKKQERREKTEMKKNKEDKEPRYGSKAMIDASKDLVRFKLVGDEFDPWSLSRMGNRDLLKGIRRVAFDWKPTNGCRRDQWAIRPFECMCNVSMPHAGQGHCHHMLAKFISLFPDLEAFYFVIEIIRDQINEVWFAEQEVKLEKQLQSSGRKRTHDGKVKSNADRVLSAKLKETKKKSASDFIKETTAIFRGIAEANENLEIFYDRKKAYYEVRREDTKCLEKHDQIWTVITRLRKRWRKGGESLRQTSAMKKRAQQTKFKVVVYEGPSKDPKKDGKKQRGA